MHNEADHARPLAGRIIGWNAVFAALVAAALIAASMIQLQSGAPLSAGAEVAESTASDASSAAVLPAVATAPLPAQSATAGSCDIVHTDSGVFRLTEAGTLSVPGFTGPGDLTAVMVSTSIGISVTGSATNLSISDADLRIIVFDFAAGLTGPGGITDNAPASLVNLSQQAGPSETITLNVNDVLSTTSDQIASDIAPYLASSVGFDVTSNGFTTTGGTADFESETFTRVTASVTVTYCHTLPPPPVSSEIIVSKTVVAGPTTGVPIQTFSISCDGGFTTTASLSSGSTTVVLDGVPAGTACQVTESDVDTSRWSTEVNGTCGTSITVLSGGSENTAAFTNTLRAGSETPLGACA